MHFGPRPKMMAAWLSSASCWLGRQRDTGAVVNIGQAFDVRFWQLPVLHTHGPSSLTFIPLGHISSVVLFIPSCWFVLLGNNSSARRGRLCWHEQGISVSSLFTAWLATHQIRLLTCATPVPTVTPRGALFLEGGMGGASHPSPQLPPLCEFNRGGAEPAQRCRQAAALTLPAAGRQFPASAGQGKGWEVGRCPLSAVSYLLPTRLTTPGALPGGVTCSAWPQHVRVHPSSQLKPQNVLR